MPIILPKAELHQVAIDEELLEKEMDEYQRRLQEIAEEDESEGVLTDEDERTELLKALEVFNKQLESIGQKKKTLQVEKQQALEAISEVETHKKYLEEVTLESANLKVEIEKHQQQEQQQSQEYLKEMEAQNAKLNEEMLTVESEISDVEGIHLSSYTHIYMYT